MSCAEFKEKSIASGYFWFNESTMDYWKTEIIYWDKLTGLFITGEPDLYGRVINYSVRQANYKTLKVDTISNFREYNSKWCALRFLSRYKKARVW